MASRRLSSLLALEVERAVARGSQEWPSLIEQFPSHSGRRQVILGDVEFVQTSCIMWVCGAGDEARITAEDSDAAGRGEG
jgi:hypothetical protein